jgi:hypothetical protein
MAKATAQAAPAPAAAESTVKSIVNPKYKDAYKDPAKKDWLAKFLDDNASLTRDKKITEGDGDGKVTKTVQVPDGVDTDALFAIAKKNGIDTAKYEAQAGSHGFAGRIRMTIGNMLRRVAKQRHGIMNAGGAFVSAPRDFLDKVDAGDKPTHNQDGSKIVAPKAAEPEAAKEPAADTAPKGKKGK